MKYFKFVDGAVVLNNDAIALYPNVKKILSRDRGGKVVGDPDGRLKKYAFKEFTYVYFRCDFEAYPAQHGMTEQETHDYAARNAGLGKDYKPDDVVLAFIKQYENEHLSPAKQAIKTLIRVFAINNKLVEKVEKSLNETLALPTLTALQTKELFEYQKQLLDVAEQVPERVKKLKAAMNLLEEEEKVQEVLRGGEIKLDSMDPGNSIETDD
jgi:hypothetical protein